MSMDIHNLPISSVTVLITSDDELETLREILTRYGQPIATDGTFRYSSHPSISSRTNYAKFEDHEWWLGRQGLRQLVTLEQLEIILHNNSQII